jgi:hypothetical protein
MISQKVLESDKEQFIIDISEEIHSIKYNEESLQILGKSGKFIKISNNSFMEYHFNLNIYKSIFLKNMIIILSFEKIIYFYYINENQLRETEIDGIDFIFSLNNQIYLIKHDSLYSLNVKNLKYFI